MLFNSHVFILAFLPICLAGYYFLRRRTHQGAVWWLILCSVVFYAYWRIDYVIILVGSTLGNYALALQLERTRSRALLVFGLALNLGLLCYFKYAGFFLGLALPDQSVPDAIKNMALPLAISFFTFQQVAYLVDVWRGVTPVSRFSSYALAVTIFPHLIAGPIVRYQYLTQQIDRIAHASRSIPRTALAGLALFIIGLSKKVLVADSLAPFATRVFDFAKAGYRVGFYDGWLGALAYTFQLYFDFSGYSDMAIGLALMMGVKLAINFFSPYKATNIIEFWRRWHISLSMFFRDYVYIPLGGSRAGQGRTILNLLIVMGLVGLWHGAGWTFVLWGLYHGLLLAVAHAWQSWRSGSFSLAPQLALAGAPKSSTEGSRGAKVTSWTITFFLVVVGWVLFRAEGLNAAVAVYKGMFFQDGWTGARLALIDPRLYWVGGALVAAGLFVSVALPNATEIMRRLHRIDGAERYIDVSLSPRGWTYLRLTPAYGAALGVLAYLSLATISAVSTEFLYFNF